MARHVKKFMGGRMTPVEVHQAFAFPAHVKCQGCQGRPLVRAITMVPYDDFVKANGPALDLIGAKFPELVMQNVVDLKGPDGTARPHVRIGVSYACKSCAPAMERALAKMPSYVVCDVHRGPTERTVVGHG